jgi:hypothetical protein
MSMPLQYIIHRQTITELASVSKGNAILIHNASDGIKNEKTIKLITDKNLTT